MCLLRYKVPGNRIAGTAKHAAGAINHRDGMKKFFLLVGIVSSMAGCVSQQSIEEHVAKYQGETLDSFVVANGAPTNKYVLQNGDSIYYWTYTKNVYIPGSATTSYVGTQAYTQYSDGGDLATQCKLDLLVSPEGIIKTVTIRKDSVGKWTSSACHEYLK